MPRPLCTNETREITSGEVASKPMGYGSKAENDDNAQGSTGNAKVTV